MPASVLISPLRTAILFITICHIIFGDVMEGYCMKCKTKMEMKDVKQVKMKNGKAANKGVCSHCGTSMFKIGG